MTDRAILNPDGQITVTDTLGNLVSFSRDIDIVIQTADVIGEAGPAVPVNVYFGISDDAIASADEATIAAVGGVGHIDGYVGEKHILIFRRDSEPVISSVVFSDDPSKTNQVGAFTMQVATVDFNGATWNAWVSNQLLTQTERVTVRVR